jgi:pre-mRNA-processing factor 8
MQMSPHDLMIHARLIGANPQLDAEKAVVITVAFPPGTCSVTAYRITPPGFEWGKNNRDFNATSLEGYSNDYFEKAQIWLSEVFLGFFMVPDDLIWNYNFIGLRADQTAKINYVLAVPRDFYHEAHRTSHFLNFNKIEDEETEDRGALEEDYFN